MSDYPTEEAYLAVCLADRIKRERIAELEETITQLKEQLNEYKDAECRAVKSEGEVLKQNANYKEQIKELVKQKYRGEE